MSLRMLSSLVFQPQSKVTVGRRGLMISRGGGEERSVELTVTPLRSQKGDLIGTVVVVRDVSELRGITRQMSYQASHDALVSLFERETPVELQFDQVTKL